VLSLTLPHVQIETTDSRSLLAQAQQGDAEAFCELCRVYEARLLRQATALCGDATMAEDLAQDTLFEAWKCIGRYNGQCQFFTWLCAILLNRFRNVLREKRPVALSSLSASGQDGVEGLLDNLADHGSRPDQMTEASERAAFLRECVWKLPARQREVIHLRFYVDDSLEGIAAALGCSVGTVKSRLFHALQKLRMMNGFSSGYGKLKLGHSEV
jgi:RNA polymerase sigma-70 factor (ECF subfamily)